MKFTPLDIQQQRFKLSLRGYNKKDVDEFLYFIAEDFTELIKKNNSLHEKNQNLVDNIHGYKDREKLLRDTLLNVQKSINLMEEESKKKARLIIGEAELKAEKLLNNAHNRLAQIHEEIIELKRQRIQLEMKLRATIDSYLKLLEMDEKEHEEFDDMESKVKFLKKA